MINIFNLEFFTIFKKELPIFFSNIKKHTELLFLILLIFFICLGVIYSNYNTNKINKNYSNLINNIYFKKTVNDSLSNLEPKLKKFNHKIQNGETLDQILRIYLDDETQIKNIKNSLSNKINLNKLKIDERIQITIDQSKKTITQFYFPISKTEKLLLTRDETGNLNPNIITKKLDKIILFKENIINQSLFKSAKVENIPASIIIEFARIYGFQIDFQRDIQKGDNFQILYEIFLDQNGKIAEVGNILFANLELRGENNKLYYFDHKQNSGYYDLNGKSVKKALMKTPINGARLSSPFGMRKHPIDGYNKLHKGTDFAAPMGTPIMASGDGIVTKASWCGGGGNCVKIKHNKTYQTVYAHMSKFASGIKKGVRVKQGQTIGYVGSTGKSTGPHLHYEVIENGKRINSQKLKLPTGKSLKNKEREIFETQKIKLEVLKSKKILETG